MIIERIKNETDEERLARIDADIQAWLKAKDRKNAWLFASLLPGSFALAGLILAFDYWYKKLIGVCG